eukprot:NODE_2_length_91304_cov_0.692462.p84 type:complete len:100 gc:universal NODE_2_length_91304_cov_0.692462:70957-70658(-)
MVTESKNCDTTIVLRETSHGRLLMSTLGFFSTFNFELEGAFDKDSGTLDFNLFGDTLSLLSETLLSVLLISPLISFSELFWTPSNLASLFPSLEGDFCF